MAAAAGIAGLLIGGPGPMTALFGLWVMIAIGLLGCAIALAAVRREEAGTDHTVVAVFGPR